VDISTAWPKSHIHTWIHPWIYPWIYPWISISTASIFYVPRGRQGKDSEEEGKRV